ncbi:hypothetical protein A2631_02790 [Candidatus Daviesbacteria bacterium RIFCSPHIGHO2_01_FULL_44_29]|uniref:Uncharacterized protein n=1 Tax=Candidatus Daviesbacteria bacterium RIFCSPHIGHO2_02_FULL_43_12 TaxID=1797776 RepID=A0A1F5KL13_9BACT|nr:MAG: hypothetical protein A2631_02790 [Candidatus Daviesbacteria bacterium RIFCSPHIGHO2_01_FULL_44_29]OGE40836.1 MAG: hypothetical protein A3E86_02560 [Candidatus Daviesbacteria bacterium RIFCSPHIGHO2_12_FULL_47_45]OGE41311.1 MAG: hypothetical protein A3D25_02185 [Candidatus Daviesbacteria bacterium RIFCSPHIGHO2_02_FULL_43_12]OGE69512.1 MAG: hypothetical protein A3B55_03925 [Candidatus Daviesbacteria bacterium RIFCSPLOWO2_01_FULL_43_15]
MTLNIKKVFGQIVHSPHFLPISIILILGLTPLLWFKPGVIIAGHDAGLPLDPIIHFIDRLNTWTHRYGIGVDQSFALGGFFIHGLEALISSMGFSLVASQKIMFIVWFVLPGLSMYYLGLTLSADRKHQSAWLIASVFYMFNHFLLQAWFVAERTKFSIYIALPFVIAMFIKVYERKVSSLKAAILVGLVLFVFNGGGFIPLYGTLFVTWICAFLFFVLLDHSWETTKRFVSFSLLALVCGVLLGAFWFIPYLYSSVHSYATSLELVGGLDGVKGWITVISENATYANLFRLQGIQEWYVNPLHPYAATFLTNPFLILASFLLPVLAFSPIFFAKGRLKKYVLFFVILSLVSMIFSAGSQPPFGSFYFFLIDHLPGFAIFRTPFYKFASSLWLAYAILIGFAINYLFSKYLILSGRIWQMLGVGAVIFGIILYSYPFLNGIFFDYEKDTKTTRVAYPEYIDTFNKQVRQFVGKENRVLLLPELSSNLNIEAYNWGFWSLATVPSLLTEISFISNNASLEEPEKKLVLSVYTKLLARDPSWVKLASFLSIDGFVVRKDFFSTQAHYETVDPKEYEDALIESGLVTKKLETGQWTYYEYKDKGDQFYLTSLPVIVDGSVNDVDLLASLKEVSPNSVIVFTGYEEQSFKKIDQEFPQKYIIASAQCEKCDLRKSSLFLPGVDTFGIGSRFYKVVKTKEDQDLAKVTLTSDRLTALKEIVYKRFVGLRDMYFQKKNVLKKIEGIKEFNSYLDRLSSLLDEPNVGNEVIINEKIVDLGDELEQLSGYIDYLYSQLSNDSEEEVLYKTLKKTEALVAKTRHLGWMTSDSINKRYLIRVPLDGDYKFLLDKPSSNFGEAIVKQGTVNFEIDGIDATRGATLRADNKWIETDSFSLKKGVHKLTFNDGLTPNLLESQVSALKNTADSGFTITANGQEKCVDFLLPSDGDRNSLYNFEFTYQNITGNQEVSFYTAIGENKKSTLSNRGMVTLHPERYEQKYSQSVALKEGESAHIYLCSRIKRYSDILTVNKFTSVALRKITKPYIAFLGGTEPPSAAKVPYDTVKVSNSKNTIHINSDKPTIVVFSEKFDPLWKMYKTLPSDGFWTRYLPLRGQDNYNHFIANGVTNGWLVPAGDHYLNIEFMSQRIFNLSVVVSVVALVSTFLLLLFLKKGKNEKNI